MESAERIMLLAARPYASEGLGLFHRSDGGRIRGSRGLSMLLLVAVLPVFVWRFAPASWALIIAPLMLLLPVLISWRRRRRPWPPGRYVAMLSGLLAVLSLVKLVPGWWPCEVACSAGAAYDHLLGFANVVLGAIAYAGLAVLTLGEGRRLYLRPGTELLIWLLLGGSLFYSVLAWRLDMLCSHCLAVHGLAWWLLPAVLPGTLRAPVPVLAVLLSALSLHAWYHPGPIRPASVDTVDVDPWLAERLHAGLGYGQAPAPSTALIVLRSECPHCREQFDSLVGDLLPLVDSGRLRLRFVIETVAGDEFSAYRGRLLLAAAIRGEFVAAYRALLLSGGLHSRQDHLDALSLAVAEIEELAALAKTDEVAILLGREQQLLGDQPGRSPRIVLYDHDKLIGMVDKDIVTFVEQRVP
jgi:hypothetical protein